VTDRDHGMGGYGARYNRLSYTDNYVQMSSGGGRVVTDGGVAVDAGDADEVEQHRHVGKTVSTNQRYWYEVHDAAEPGKVRLLAIDNVPNRVLTHEELDECMADGWNIVYDGHTGELGGDLHE
jgi:hypothetical protein